VTSQSEWNEPNRHGGMMMRRGPGSAYYHNNNLEGYLNISNLPNLERAFEVAKRIEGLELGTVISAGVFKDGDSANFSVMASIIAYFGHNTDYMKAIQQVVENAVKEMESQMGPLATTLVEPIHNPGMHKGMRHNLLQVTGENLDLSHAIEVARRIQGQELGAVISAEVFKDGDSADLNVIVSLQAPNLAKLKELMSVAEEAAKEVVSSATARAWFGEPRPERFDPHI
jgi:hypothetical protein